MYRTQNPCGNIKNMPLSGYNCAGYALETFDWYQIDKFYEKSPEEAAEQILDDFPNLKQIFPKNLADLPKNKEIIAYRQGEWDFHFVKRYKNNIWYHKRGSSSISIFPKKNLFAESWCNGKYDSEIMFFVKN